MKILKTFVNILKHDNSMTDNLIYSRQILLLKGELEKCVTCVVNGAKLLFSFFSMNQICLKILIIIIWNECSINLFQNYQIFTVADDSVRDNAYVA